MPASLAWVCVVPVTVVCAAKADIGFDVFTAHNQNSPVFVQWLECVWQVLQQFPTRFEFNEVRLGGCMCIYRTAHGLVCALAHVVVIVRGCACPQNFLLAIAYHCSSDWFCTFLGDCERERKLYTAAT